MPSYTATQIDNAEYPETFVVGPDQVTGQRSFIVQTSVPADAIRYGQLPAKGSAWDNNWPEVLLKTFTAKRLCGRTQVSNVRYGHCVVTAMYETPGRRWSQPIPALGGKWSEKRSAELSQQAYFDVDGNEPPIEDGEGVALQKGQVLFDVGVYLQAGGGDFPRWNALEVARSFNSDSVTLPPLFGDSTQYTVPAQTAQYMGYQAEMVTGPSGRLLKVVHSLAVGVSPFYSWRKRDAEGNPVEAIESQVYPLASFAGLW